MSLYFIHPTGRRCFSRSSMIRQSERSKQSRFPSLGIHTKDLMQRFLTRQHGHSTTEYAVLLAIVLISIVAAVQLVSRQVEGVQQSLDPGISASAQP